MSPDPKSREEAIKRLNARASDLEAATAQKTAEAISATAVTSQAYKIVAELIGGVLLGVAIGFVVDRFAGTTPWGLISGTFLGFGLSIYMARRTANRLMAQAKASGIEPQSIPFDDDEDEER
ncbi:AtpZ/AtpI family protein [Brevundimonas sp.]|uniref:AtpZ/AtpI family protein n=1 Tax=Brevundimonas sp. TaxID=1871086 RepID=UPI00391BA679